MKTTAPNSAKIILLARAFTRIITPQVFKASLIVARYGGWFLTVLIFFSCQKNLTQNSETAAVTATTQSAPVEKFVTIGTTESFVCVHRTSLSDSLTKRIHQKMTRFYAMNDLKTKWLQENGVAPVYQAFIDHLKNAASYGLNAGDYHVEELEHRVKLMYQDRPTPSDIVKADIEITETFFLFGIHLREGRISDPGYRGHIWKIQNRSTDNADVAMLASVTSSTDLDDVIVTLEPASQQYIKLQQQLMMYRSLAAKEIEFSLGDTEKIKIGEVHAAIPAIRKKLRLMNVYSGAIAGESSDSLLFDEQLLSAVKLFQERHGLAQDGVIGGKTLFYLSQSFNVKADLIALNMERMRWLPEHDGSLIHVNIPEFKLRIYEEGKQTLEMNVIVGAVSSATPVFYDTLEHVVLSPTWTVPPSLVKEEFLPRLRKKRNYYANRNDFTFYKNGVQIDPSTEDWEKVVNVHEYRIVQSPGATNALGQAKFVMPNNMNIYLHDTPDHKPFSDRYRALSHGCIRLDDPARFAAYLLRNESSWNMSKIQKAMTGETATKIELKKKYQVCLEYNTVWVDDAGNLNFRDDIYGHDKRQLRQLTQLDHLGPNAWAELRASSH